jgi:TRAP-type uncharacterized transport system fused permease subunit
VLTILFHRLASLVLGMGVPVTAAYLITAVVAVPALTHLGVNEIAAHMIVYWLSQDSNITPPVCIAAFAGATIAKANMWRTAFSPPSSSPSFSTWGRSCSATCRLSPWTAAPWTSSRPLF